MSHPHELPLTLALWDEAAARGPAYVHALHQQADRQQAPRPADPSALAFITDVLAGTIVLDQLPPRTLFDWYEYWTVRYDELYTAAQAQQIIAVMRQLEAAMAPHLPPT